MEVVEQQLREGTYGGLKAREARLKERHDAHVSGKEADEVRRLAQLKLLEKVRRNTCLRPPYCRICALFQVQTIYCLAMHSYCAMSPGFWTSSP